MKFTIKKDHDLELAGYDANDLLVIEGVAFHSGTNANGAVIFKEDAKKDITTMIGKPLRVLWQGKPTGHGYNKMNNTFDKNVMNIGYIHNADIVDGENDEYKAEVQAIMWKKYYPEIAEKLIELDKKGELKFSIEAERKIEVLKNGDRRCFDNNFTGLAMVANPAWDKSKSFMVAEDETTESSSDAPKGGKNASSKETDTNSQVDVKDKEALINAKLQLIESQKENDNLTKELLKYQKIAKDYEIKEKGQQRLTKLSKYGEVKDSVEELGNLSDIDFVNKLEALVDEYAKNIDKKKDEQKNEPTDSISTLIDTRKKTEQKEPKEALLDILRRK